MRVLASVARNARHARIVRVVAVTNATSVSIAQNALSLQKDVGVEGKTQPANAALVKNARAKSANGKSGGRRMRTSGTGSTGVLGPTRTLTARTHP